MGEEIKKTVGICRSSLARLSEVHHVSTLHGTRMKEDRILLPTICRSLIGVETLLGSHEVANGFRDP